jgi:hypothetical protein
MNTTRHTIAGGIITLYRFALDSSPVIIERGATVPMDSGEVWIHDWKINDRTVAIRYSMSDSLYAAILDGEFPLYSLDIPATPPKGKGWAWSDGRWSRKGGTEVRNV